MHTSHAHGYDNMLYSEFGYTCQKDFFEGMVEMSAEKIGTKTGYEG